MAFLDWKPEFTLGIDDIDRQHRRLVEIINQLHDAMRQGAPKPMLQRVLSDLIAYARTHFQTEERAMFSAGYAGYEPHCEQHRELTGKVMRFERDLAAGKVALSVPLMGFLKSWLAEHILSSDRGYVPAVQASRTGTRVPAA